MNRLYKKTPSQSGLAAIEYAALLPGLLLAAFFVIDFGRLLFQYDALTKSTRDAARYLGAQVRPPAAAYPTDATYSAAVASATNLAVCGSISTCNDAVVSGLTASNITIDYPASGVSGINYVRVSVQNYSNSFITNVLGASFTKNLGTVSVTMRQIQQ